jgi:hypothetical protein
MKIIITEDQENRLKKLFDQLLITKGLPTTIKSAGGFNKLMSILDIPINRKNKIKLILDELERHTELRGHHYYLFDCNISIFLSHLDKRNPVFAGSPNCWGEIINNYFNKDLERNAVDQYKIWSKYSKYIIDRYKNDFLRK